MNRFLLIPLALGIAAPDFAQRITAIHPDESGEMVVIECDRLPSGTPAIEIREGDGSWRKLESLKQTGLGQFVWDIFGESPLGVTNASFRLTGFTIDDIPEDTKISGFSKASLKYGKVFGHNYYYVRTKRDSQWNQGKWRDGAVFTYVDDVTIRADVLIYDFLTDKWEVMTDVDVWRKQVPRQTCNGRFKKPTEPTYTVEETADGAVKLNGKVKVSPDEAADFGIIRGVTIHPLFSVFTRNYVDREIAPWEKRGEYEKTDDYEARMANEREARVKELSEEARNAYLSALTPKNIREGMSISDYNADDEYFTIHSPYYGRIKLFVPISEAEKFKKDWHKVKAIGQYDIIDDTFATTLIDFRLGKKNYRYLPGRN